MTARVSTFIATPFNITGETRHLVPAGPEPESYMPTGIPRKVDVNPTGSTLHRGPDRRMECGGVRRARPAPVRIRRGTGAAPREGDRPVPRRDAEPGFAHGPLGPLSPPRRLRRSILRERRRRAAHQRGPGDGRRRSQRRKHRAGHRHRRSGDDITACQSNQDPPRHRRATRLVWDEAPAWSRCPISRRQT
jgi:hypothetical protein